MMEGYESNQDPVFSLSRLFPPSFPFLSLSLSLSFSPLPPLSLLDYYN